MRILMSSASARGDPSVLAVGNLIVRLSVPGAVDTPAKESKVGASGLERFVGAMPTHGGANILVPVLAPAANTVIPGRKTIPIFLVLMAVLCHHKVH